MDSPTTVEQKRRSLREIESWLQYVQISGLHKIALADLRTAEKALAQVDTQVLGEQETKTAIDPLWAAFRAGANASLPVPMVDERQLSDWAELRQEYQEFRRTLEA